MGIGHIILVYLSAGILSNFLGPVAKEINPTIQFPKVIPRNIVEIIKILTLRLIVIIIFPILYLAFLIDCFWPAKNSANYNQYYILLNAEYFNNENSFHDFGYNGIKFIQCEKCEIKDKAVHFTHDFGPYSWTTSGYHCKSCGKYHEIEWDSENSKGKLCECGGYLSRGNPLFCPKCKSKKLKYYLEYIT